jgi:AcrR family transcriptional regulator
MSAASLATSQDHQPLSATTDVFAKPVGAQGLANPAFRPNRSSSRRMRQTSIAPARRPHASQADETPSPLAPLTRKRLSNAERERQIVDGAVRFFADRGLDGQLRDLATKIGVTHALLYHYFPTKQALIDRVYVEIFEGLWQPDWDRLLDDRKLDAETKLTRFYRAYAKAIFTREFVRIMIFSGLSDHTIPDRFFALLRERLFPRLIRATRRHCGIVSRSRPSARELELLMGLHGGIFYIGLRRWVYEQPVHGAEASEHDDAYIADRVNSYLLSAGPVLYQQREAARNKRKA